MPGIGDGGSRPGRPNRPDRPGNGGDRPGRPDRPDRPGNGGDRPGRPNRPDRPGNGGDRPGRPDRPGYRPPYYGNRPWHGSWHNHWHHGYWHGHWHSPWRYRWSNYPVYATLGLTWWGVDRLCYQFGYSGYSNPYYTAGTTTVYNYSEPLVYYPSDDDANAVQEEVPTQTRDNFDEARAAFYEGDYSEALTKTDAAIRGVPDDVNMHEFRALVLFALGRYEEAAETLYAVLSVSPGWDWTTMISLYKDSADYTTQLRSLEQYRNEHPNQSTAYFLLGYQYLTAGHDAEARNEFQRVVDLDSNNAVAKKLLEMLGGKDGETDPEPLPASDAPAVDAKSLQGTWKASRGSSEFLMTLDPDKAFTWTYTDQGKPQTVTGQYYTEGATLVLEPTEGGAMPALVQFDGKDGFNYRVIGGDVNDSGLDFRRSR
ncbi:MAG: tetratricopeptide repeat protein [Planctomycetaceae bacterium]|nr:tetratricopeptide repeat protein [Planctomycetaceae bacterium]